MMNDTHKLRITSGTRSRIEQDIAEIKMMIGGLATKGDMHELKVLINARADDILEAVSWTRKSA